MLAEKAIVNILMNTSNVTDLIGNRIYPKNLPQPPTLPAIVYMQVSGARISSLQGASGLAHPRLQIDVFAETYDEVKLLAKRVQNALEGQRDTFAGVNVQGIIFEGDHDMNDDVEANLVEDQHRVMMEFTIWHNE